MDYKGVKGVFSNIEINVPGMKQICIANSGSEIIIATMYLPEYKITEEIRATAALLASSFSLLKALEELVRLKEWKDIHGKDEGYEISKTFAWDNAREALALALKIK